MRPATTETIHKEAIKAIEDRIAGLDKARNEYRKQAHEHTAIAMEATRQAIATDEKIGVMRHTIRCLEGEFKAHGEAVNPSGFGPEGSGSNPDAPATEPSHGFTVEAEQPTTKSISWNDVITVAHLLKAVGTTGRVFNKRVVQSVEHGRRLQRLFDGASERNLITILARHDEDGLQVTLTEAGLRRLAAINEPITIVEADRPE